MISSLTSKGQMRWYIVDGALNADILIDFPRGLVKGATKKVLLILDHLREHHAKSAKATARRLRSVKRQLELTREYFEHDLVAMLNN